MASALGSTPRSSYGSNVGGGFMACLVPGRSGCAALPAHAAEGLLDALLERGTGSERGDGAACRFTGLARVVAERLERAQDLGLATGLARRRRSRATRGHLLPELEHDPSREAL